MSRPFDEAAWLQLGRKLWEGDVRGRWGVFPAIVAELHGTVETDGLSFIDWATMARRLEAAGQDLQLDVHDDAWRALTALVERAEGMQRSLAALDEIATVTPPA